MTTQTQRPYTDGEERRALKQRVFDIEPKIGKDYINDICKVLPELDTPQGRRKLENVKAGKAIHKDIVEILEKYAENRDAFMAMLKQSL